MAAASSTWSQGAIHNVSLHSARCTGFCQLRGPKRDYAYVLSIEWTDDRRLFVKRTYSELQAFHKALVRLFPALRQVEKAKLNLGAGITSGLKDFMTKDKRTLAESRELLVDTYLRNLLLLPPQITQSSLLLSFFESRKTDPKPCKSNSPSEKSDSGIDLTGDQSAAERRLHPDGDSSQQSSPQSDSSGGEGRRRSKAKSHKSSDVDDDNVESPEEFLQSEYDGDSEDGCRSRRHRHGTRPRTGEDCDDEDCDGDDVEDPSQDYFLDVAISELMLNSSMSGMTASSSGGGTNAATDSSAPTSPETSMWCSTGDKFSQILASNMPHGVPSSGDAYEAASLRRRRHLASTLCAVVSDDDDDDDLIDRLAIRRFSDGEDNEGGAVGGSKSQRPSQSHDDDGEFVEEAELESDDEFSIRPIAKPDMGQYYLSTVDIKEDL